MAARASLAALLALFSGADGQLLPGHSITATDQVYALAANWFLGGTMVPVKSGMIMSPGVLDRMGALLSLKPLLTDNFEVTFKLKARRPASRKAKDGGLAMWYTNGENMTQALETLITDSAQTMESMQSSSWQEKFNSAGFDLFQYRSKFDGLGVFFVDEDTPSVSVVPGNGQNQFKLGAGIPTYDAMKFDFMTGNEVDVKISVQKDKAKVTLPGHEVEVKNTFKSGGYLGFTVYGGSKGDAKPTDQGPYFEIKDLQVVNNDRSAKGEDFVEVTTPAPVPEDEKMDAMAEASSHKDHRAESDAIKDLTNVIFKLVVESQPIRAQMEKTIHSLAKRIDLMEANFNELKAELDKKTGHNLGKEFEAIKRELSSLSTVATKETQERHQRLETLHSDIADVHKSAHSPDSIDRHLDTLANSNNQVLEQLNNEHQRMFGVSIMAIAFIIIAGLSLYNKFRCWEKKHVL